LINLPTLLFLANDNQHANAMQANKKNTKEYKAAKAFIPLILVPPIRARAKTHINQSQ
jgi:hypothetical protein